MFNLIYYNQFGKLYKEYLILRQGSRVWVYDDVQTTQSFTLSLSFSKEVIAHSQCPPFSGPGHSKIKVWSEKTKNILMDV